MRSVIDSRRNLRCQLCQSYNHPGKNINHHHHQPKLTASNLHLTGRTSPNSIDLIKKTHKKKVGEKFTTLFINNTSTLRMKISYKGICTALQRETSLCYSKQTRISRFLDSLMLSFLSKYFITLLLDSLAYSFATTAYMGIILMLLLFCLFYITKVNIKHCTFYQYRFKPVNVGIKADNPKENLSIHWKD